MLVNCLCSILYKIIKNRSYFLDNFQLFYVIYQNLLIHVINLYNVARRYKY